MGNKEKLGMGRKDYEPSPLANRILSIGIQWKIEGTPFWTGTAMAKGMEEAGEEVFVGKLLKELRRLEKHNALLAQWANGIKDKPTSHIAFSKPPVEVDGVGIGRFYQVSEIGQQLRKPITQAEKGQVTLQGLPPVPNV